MRTQVLISITLALFLTSSGRAADKNATGKQNKVKQEANTFDLSTIIDKGTDEGDASPLPYTTGLPKMTAAEFARLNQGAKVVKKFKLNKSSQGRPLVTLERSLWDASVCIFRGPWNERTVNIRVYMKLKGEKMMATKTQLGKSLRITCLALLVASLSLSTGKAAEKKNLKIVVLMGQSNMVGYAHPCTAWYLTQPIYVPPAKVATVKSERYNSGQFYWKGVGFAHGDSKEFNAIGQALLKERKEVVRLWRGRYYGVFGRSAKAAGKTRKDWNDKEWGTPPNELEEYKGMRMRSFMKLWLPKKVQESGVEKRMLELIESKENKFHPTVAVKAIAQRDEAIAEDLKRVRELFLKSTKPEDFDALNEARKSFGKVTAENRMAYSELLKKHVNLPIPERTHISALGAVAGQLFEDERQAMSHGPLSHGFTKFADRCGPEYPFGVSFERMVDGPVLLIKCAWGGKSLNGDFRPPSLSTAERPIGLYWKMSMQHIKSVLADLGKYHPDYDAKAGYEMAGLVWFQGWNDKGNTKYGEQLVHFIKDFRKEVKSPKLPVVCGLLGHSTWKHSVFAGDDVNAGMLYAAKHPDLKGTVDIVNTTKYFPIELDLAYAARGAFEEGTKEHAEAQNVLSRAVSKDGVHYHGSAKFIYLTGDAMARKLANLLKGGDPTIHKEAEEILGTK